MCNLVITVNFIQIGHLTETVIFDFLEKYLRITVGYFIKIFFCSIENLNLIDIGKFNKIFLI